MMDSNQKKKLGRVRRQRRIRAKISGTAERPRLAVFRSAKHISVQLIDDVAGKTLCAVTDTAVAKKDVAKATKGETARAAKVALAYVVGQLLAEKAKSAGITRVVFDRGGRAYTGRVAALADGARVGGLEF